MSAIAGAVGGDGRAVDRRIVQCMLDAMPHRGSGGCRLLHGGTVSLGLAQRRTAAEAGEGALPRMSGKLALTADARLDNRDELIEALRPSGGDMSDSALILAAYLRWGEECPSHLLGDFAFALWDGGRNRLFCARDHFGVKPFYYCRTAGGDFFFGSEIKALFALPNVPQRIDEARIGDFLIGLLPEEPHTFYESVAPLPAAHSLSLEGGSPRRRRYWQLEPSTPSGVDHAAEFRALFTAAVECRMRGPEPVGAMLSGGLDSSAIACVAAPILMRDRGRPLPTFSLVFDKTPALSERHHIEAVLARGGFAPIFVEADSYAFEDFDALLAEQDGVFSAPGLGVSRALYRAAANRGVGVLLNGHGGDEVVSHGEGRLAELARSSRWIALWREIRGLAAIDGDAAWPSFAAHLERYGPGRHLRPARRLAARALRPVRGRQAAAPVGPLSLVNPDLAARTNLAARYRETMLAAAANADERERHRRVLSSAMTASAFEVLDKAAAFAGIEFRYPFFDRRLVEFCVGLPSVEKLDGGWSRLILRRAMQSVLPPAIQWRRDKLDFSPHVVRGMLDRYDALLGRIHDDADGVGRYVDLPTVRAAHARIRARREAASGSDVQMVWRTAALSLWLRRLRGTSPNAIAAA